MKTFAIQRPNREWGRFLFLSYRNDFWSAYTHLLSRYGKTTPPVVTVVNKVIFDPSSFKRELTSFAAC